MSAPIIAIIKKTKGALFPFRAWLMAVCSIVPLWGSAQDPVHRVINDWNGLPSNTVYDIYQDHRGYIWVAHDRGLSRYDGRKFVNYRTPIRQGRSLFNLMAYGQTIYCQDFSGHFFYVSGDSLVEETALSATGSFVPSAIIRDSLLVSVYRDSIRTLNLNLHRVKTRYVDGKFNLGIYHQEGSILALNSRGIVETDGYRERFQSANIGESFYIVRTTAGIFGIAKSQTPYITRLSPTYETLPLLPPGLFIQNVSVTQDEVWICTSSGAYAFDHTWKPLYGGQCIFPQTSISEVMRDREGSYWFTTLNKGLLMVPNLQVRLYHYNQASITALAPVHNGDGLLVGTEDSDVLAFRGGAFTPRFHDEARHEVISLYQAPDGDQLFWSASRFIVQQPHRRIFMDYAVKNVTLIQPHVYALAHAGGVLLMTTKDAQVPDWLVPHITDTVHGCYTLGREAIRTRWVMYQPSDSTLYMATTTGLQYVSPRGRGAVRLAGRDIFATQLQVNGADTWVSTFSDGMLLVRSREVSRQVRLYPGAAGDHTIYRFQIEGRRLWMIADGHVKHYDLDTNREVTLSTEDGLPQAELKDILVQGGTVYLATTLGLVMFEAQLSTFNATPPVLHLDRLSVNRASMAYVPEMVLAADQNQVDISFAALGFRGEDAVTVQYKINDSPWRLLGNGVRELNLPALSPGKYVITLRAFNEDQVMSREPLVLTFEVAAPFYRQYWFMLLVLALAVLVVYIYFGIRVNNINQRNDLLAQKLKLEQELQKSMLSSIKSQMNPHFIFNALNTIQAYIYTNDKENASMYLSKFSQLTRSILEMSNRDTVPLQDEIRTLTLYLELEKIRFEDRLHYSLVVEDHLEVDMIHIPSMLIQPYVENAIKHGLLHKKEDRKLMVAFRREAEGILVTIDDNGIGRRRSAELKSLRERNHRSFAMSANQKRLHILNQGMKTPIVMEIVDKTNELGEPLGTTVKIHIPTKRNTL